MKCYITLFHPWYISYSFRAIFVPGYLWNLWRNGEDKKIKTKQGDRTEVWMWGRIVSYCVCTKHSGCIFYQTFVLTVMIKEFYFPYTVYSLLWVQPHTFSLHCIFLFSPDFSASYNLLSLRQLAEFILPVFSHQTLWTFTLLVIKMTKNEHFIIYFF